MLIPSLAILIPVLIALLVLVLKSFGINQEYQRGVLFRLGRLAPTKGPGWYWLIPFVDRVIRVDMRTIPISSKPRRRLRATALRCGSTRFCGSAPIPRST